MTTFNKQGVLMDKWFKAPNAIVDDITGDIISPQAAAILNSILRLTEGVRGRNWASIPHSFFMRKTRAKRRETIGNYINELIDNKLIHVNKSNGKVTEYAINWQSKLWYSTPELEQKTTSSVPVRFIRTSTFHPYIPVRFIRTGSWETSTFHPYTYKDILPKDNSKDIKKDDSTKKSSASQSQKSSTDKKVKSQSNASNQDWIDEKFEAFYKIYPKKKSKGQAIKTWNDIFLGKKDHKKPSDPEVLFQEIIAGLNAQIPSILAQEERFRKHPSTWLNAQAWLDEVSQPPVSHQSSKPQRSTPDPLAVNAKYNVPTEMTDEEKRAWFSGGSDNTMPSDTALDDNYDYDYYYG